MSVIPSISSFRETVNAIDNDRDRVLIETYYLTASRACELLTHGTPYDLKHGKSRPYGSEMEWRLDDYTAPSLKEEKAEKVLVMNIRIAKRKKPVRKNIGLPCDPKHEPWTIDLLRYIQQHGTINFDMTRTRLWQIVKKRLAGLDPAVHTHSLRHYRLTHLADFYGFDPIDLIIYAGWTYGAALGGQGAMLDIYVHLDWRRYFPKLLRPMK